MSGGGISSGIVRVVALLVAALSAATGLAKSCECATEDEWNFRVFLDDSEIGYHNFRLTTEDGLTRVTTEADFRVKFLFLTAYRYQHANTEIWRDNCLVNIDASTNANGKALLVTGSLDNNGFNIETDAASEPLGDCVKTFAYWNPAVFLESELLNSQTGQLLAVDVELSNDEFVDVYGGVTPATRYRLVAKDIKLDVWYSSDNRWLGLESTIKGGRKLRYELV